ncbi:MAG: hypothetical protein JW828_06720 [Sedimentisphaerales bacterium]|nr:hypothetical protein [Sedimentisphaerales bacterium]
MNSAQQRAQQFLEHEKAFRLGTLLTESAHPKTLHLSQTTEKDLPAAIRLLQEVDRDIPPVAMKVLQGEPFQALRQRVLNAMKDRKRIFFTGCGSTGRLSILLEAAWRNFWQTLKHEHARIAGKIPDLEEAAYSVMAGGDFALIKAVEGFEDFPDFGRYQIRQGGVSSGDVVVAITEGGETSFVIGTAWEGLDAGADVFFVYNNPSDLLCRHVERSRRIIEDPRIVKIELATGPMAITGSTRMQATTIELLIVGAAIELALTDFLKVHLSGQDFQQLGFEPTDPNKYHDRFIRLLEQLETDPSIRQLAAMVALEKEIYARHGLVTYLAEDGMLDVLTDTTERAPTFMLPPFRKFDDAYSPRSWSFIKNPFLPTPQAWQHMLRRLPRGLDWSIETYKSINAPPVVQANPPRLDNTEIYKFQIGNEPDPSRTDTADSALLAVCTTDQWPHLAPALDKDWGPFRRKGALLIGPAAQTGRGDNLFAIGCDLPSSPLQLWEHLAIKLVLNSVSTATMAAMGRVVGNAMSWVSPSNKKLIDRGSRLIAQLAGCPYDRACVALFEAMDEIEQMRLRNEEVPSPVALAIDRLKCRSKG